MNEARLKGALMRTLRDELKGFVFIRHEDKFQNGVPDLSVTGCGWTSWWEIKYANPHCESSAVQDVMLAKLDKSGFARYIVYDVNPVHEVFVVTPLIYRLHKKGVITTLLPHCDACTAGFNHKWLAQYVSEVHHARRTQSVNVNTSDDASEGRAKRSSR